MNKKELILVIKISTLIMFKKRYPFTDVIKRNSNHTETLFFFLFNEAAVIWNM
jgi:hypothetical protein